MDIVAKFDNSCACVKQSSMQGLQAGPSTTGKLHKSYINKVLFREQTKIPRYDAKETVFCTKVFCLERSSFCALFDGIVNSWDVCGTGDGGELMEVSRRNLLIQAKN